MKKTIAFLLTASFSFLVATVALVRFDLQPRVALRHIMQTASLAFYQTPRPEAPPLPTPSRRVTAPITAASSSASSTASGTASTTEIAVDDWRIFYRQTAFDKAGAYTLRFPREWGVNDEEEGQVIFSYVSDGRLYTVVLTDEEQDPAPGGNDTTKTATTTINDKEWRVKEYVSHGTTTLLVYEPKVSPRPFARLIATLPPKKSAQTAALVHRLLETLAVESVTRPFVVRSLFVRPTVLQPLSRTAFPKTGEIRWSLTNLSKEAKKFLTLHFTVEDDEGKVLLTLPEVHDPKKQRLVLALPPLCEAVGNEKPCLSRSDVSFTRPYYVVLRGFACKDPQQTVCPERLRVKAKPVRSNAFLITDAKEFQNPTMTVRSEPGTTQWRITASVIGRGEPSEQFVVVFDDGAYEVLSSEDGIHFKKSFLRRFEKGQTVTISLIRVPTAAVRARFYGATTDTEIISLGRVLITKRLSF